MNLFSQAVGAVGAGRQPTGAAPGHDSVGHGVQPPQAEGAAEDDAAVRVGRVAYRALTGSTPGHATRSRLGTAVHYAFGATVGACYAVAAQRLPIMRAGHGTAYGTAVWMVADEMIMPVLGLSRGPGRLPLGVHAYALASHWIYGLALESAVRGGRGEWSSPRQGTMGRGQGLSMAGRRAPA